MRGKHFMRRDLLNQRLGLPNGTPKKALPRTAPRPTPIVDERETHSVWTLTKLSVLTVTALSRAGLDTVGDVKNWMRDSKRPRIKGIGPVTFGRVVQQVNMYLSGARGTVVATTA